MQQTIYSLTDVLKYHIKFFLTVFPNEIHTTAASLMCIWFNYFTDVNLRTLILLYLFIQHTVGNADAYAH